MTIFLVVALKTQNKTTKLTATTVQICSISFKKSTLALPRGCTLSLEVHLQLSPVNLPPPHFFLRPRGAHARSTPTGYAYDSVNR